MKKIYIAPASKVFNIKVANIMAGSFEEAHQSVGYSEDAGGYGKKNNFVVDEDWEDEE